MKKIWYLFLCLFIVQVVSAQSIQQNKIYLEFKRLAYLRGQYEGYSKLYETQQHNTNIKDKKDSLLMLYTSMIKKIKQKRQVYLNHINWAIINNKLDSNYRRIPYNYFPSIMSTDPTSNTISELDLYKIIRYSLYEKKYDMLPDLSNIPFYDKKKLERRSNKDIDTLVTPKN